ncbi:hypothetical protein KIL84_000291 [Mauremys mutica]|uniref:Uncharacterized protein n=1 Tax=Mauremys mutica TaxID=74926 RepID=A0A9D3XGZ8_9SAUR|nr:hypothetical protein KIL84_000291 [Mauremys mutica]
MLHWCVTYCNSNALQQNMRRPLAPQTQPGSCQLIKLCWEYIASEAPVHTSAVQGLSELLSRLPGSSPSEVGCWGWWRSRTERGGVDHTHLWNELAAAQKSPLQRFLP